MWDAEHWSFVLGLVALVGVNWVFALPQRAYRWIRPKPDPVTRVMLVPDPAQPDPPAAKPIARINLPSIQRQIFGREVELGQVRDALVAQGQAAVTAVVQGHGGYGKSTLARYYMQQFEAEYDGFLWINAEQSNTLMENLLRAAPYLNLGLGNAPLREKALSVRDALCAEGHWLIVFDNVTDYGSVKEMIPEGPHVIVTTREAEGWGTWPKVRPKVLPWDEPDSPAVQVLLTEAESDDAAGAQALAEALGGLPLALVVAGALAREEGFDRVKDDIVEVLRTAPRNTDYDDSVIGAVTVSYDRLEADARWVLDVLAWWDVERLSVDLFTGGVEGRYRDLDPDLIGAEGIALAKDETRLRRAFRELRAASLLKRQDGAETDEMHRMTAAALRAMQAARGDTSPVTAAVELLAAVYPCDSDHSGSWPLCARLTPHVSALWHAVEPQTQTGPAPGGAALDYLLNQGGVYLDKIGDQAGDLAMAQASLTLTQARLPADHRHIAVGLANLASAQADQGAFDQAEDLLAQAVALDREHRPDSADLADHFDLSGFVRLARVRAGQGGDLAEARDWHEEALALYKQHFGPRHENVAQVLNNLGLVHDQMGDPGTAATCYAQSLEIFREVLPPGDARLAYGCLNVGALRLKAGQARQAEDLLREAYDLWNALLPPDHPDLRNAADWLTTCYLTLARQPGAKGLYEVKAKPICARHGLDLATQQADADKLPLTMEAE